MFCFILLLECDSLHSYTVGAEIYNEKKNIAVVWEFPVYQPQRLPVYTHISFHRD